MRKVILVVTQQQEILSTNITRNKKRVLNVNIGMVRMCMLSSR